MNIFLPEQILELNLPDGALIALIKRDDEFFVPEGGTELRAGDRQLVLADKETFEKVRSIIGVRVSVRLSYNVRQLYSDRPPALYETLKSTCMNCFL